MSVNNESGKHIIPKWLKELQDNSWELELLISGGAIFTLFQISDIWLNWLESMSIISFLPGRAIFMLLGTLGLETLKLGFVLHLILRSYWLAMVCINYVFPDGIRKDKVKWKKPFAMDIEENEDLQKQIVSVDKLCGLVMYLSIISTFLLAGIIFTIFITLSVPLINQVSTGAVGVILLFAFLVYIADLLLSGILRKVPYISYILYPFFLFYDLLSLRKIYQKPALLFYSNISYWKFTLSAALFFTIAGTFSYLNIYRIMHWPNVFDKREYKWQMSDNDAINYSFYRDELDNGEFRFVLIPSKIIKGNFLEVFIRYEKWSDDLIERIDRPDSLRFFSNAVAVAIDDSIYTETEWFPTWNERIENIGITAMIPIQNLKNGKHILRVGCSNNVSKPESVWEHDFCNDPPSTIPFWKDN